jgi:peptidoglycan/xylan/chitin deacetylase (PgdA/CDA1 family)
LTFDDFSRSAAGVAGKMLSDYGVRGTYYAALSMMGTKTVVDEMFERSDLETLVSAGHEIACHTFGHVLCRDVAGPELLENCRNNRMRLAELLNGYAFESFSFPEGVVTVSAKSVLNSVYQSCRTIEHPVRKTFEWTSSAGQIRFRSDYDE